MFEITPTLASDAPANCTCFNLRKAARAVTQAYDEALKSTGLRVTQVQLLWVISEAGPAPITELAKRMVMDRTTLTRNLKPLIEKNLLEVRGSVDQRRRPIALTEDGRALLERARPLWNKVQSRLVQGLGKDGWNDLLRRLNQAVRLTEAERGAP